MGSLPLPRRRLLWCGAAVLIGLALALRCYVLARGNFYWDDVVFQSRAGRSFGDFGAWWTDYDGHFMPGSLLLAMAIGKAAPLSWAAAAASLLVLQLAAMLTTLRTLVIVAGRRPVVLLPLTFYLFSPITIPGFAWWASGLNALTLQIAMAVAVGESVRFLRGRRRCGAYAVAAFAVGLLCFEKAAVIPFVALAAVALARFLRGHPRPLRSVLVRGRWLWTGYGIVTAAWLVVYLLQVSTRPGDHTLQYTGRALVRSVRAVVAPAVLGGPWGWFRVNPGPPVATVPVWLAALGGLAVLAVLFVTAIRAPRAMLVWGLAGGYLVLALGPVLWLRSSENTSILLPQSLRYFPDFAWVLTLSATLVCLVYTGGPAAARLRRWGVIAVVVFVVSGSVSTVRFATVWADNPTGEYLANIRAGAAEYAGRPMLDQELNPDIVGKLAYPENWLSRLLGASRAGPVIRDYSTEPTVVSPNGEMVTGKVSRVRTVGVGPIPGCGFRIDGGGITVLPFEGRISYWEWSFQMNYLASGEGSVTIEQAHLGSPVTVPVRRGPHTVYVRVPGMGDALEVTASPGLIVCISSGPVGLLVPDATADSAH